MDYKRIYDEFIIDRRLREPKLVGYFEHHHILPRSLDGGDEPKNIIRLTAEDHLRAHLLLAHIFGGNQWYAVHMMLADGRGDPRKGKIPSRKARFAYGLARKHTSKLQSERMAGENHPLFGTKRSEDTLQKMSAGIRKHYENNDVHNIDRTTYAFKHVPTGEVFKGTRKEFKNHAPQKLTGLTQMILGTYKSCDGWIINGNTENVGKASAKPNVDIKVYEFVNLDGRNITATQVEFKLKTKLSPAGVSTLVNKKRDQLSGWYLNGTNVRLSRALPNKQFLWSNGEEEVVASNAEMAEMFGGWRQSYGKVSRGKSSDFKGWCVVETNQTSTGTDILNEDSA